MIRSLSPPGELHADGDGRKEAAMEAEFAGDAHGDGNICCGNPAEMEKNHAGCRRK